MLQYIGKEKKSMQSRRQFGRTKPPQNYSDLTCTISNFLVLFKSKQRKVKVKESRL